MHCMRLTEERVTPLYEAVGVSDHAFGPYLVCLAVDARYFVRSRILIESKARDNVVDR